MRVSSLLVYLLLSVLGVVYNGEAVAFVSNGEAKREDYVPDAIVFDGVQSKEVIITNAGVDYVVPFIYPLFRAINEPNLLVSPDMYVSVVLLDENEDRPIKVLNLIGFVLINLRVGMKIGIEHIRVVGVLLDSFIDVNLSVVVQMRSVIEVNV